MSNADEIRWKQRLENFGHALAHLTEACEQDRYSDLERAGLIKIFEFCFELSWKVLKDLLFYDGYETQVPRTTIRKSFDSGYIDEEDCGTLIDALEKRNILSHAYRRNLALESESLIKDRYHPALVRLHTSLSERALR